jgi:uncharacterized damage-inducible protein DinB
MPASDPITILLAQNHWATRNLLDACDDLTTEQFHQRFEIGPGSLHDTITHILGAMRRWGDMLAGREERPRLETQGPHTAQELLGLLDEIGGDLKATAARHPLDGIVSGSRGGRTYSFTRGAVLTHVLTHGMHHRAQCLNMLRHLGHEPLPPSSVLEWIFMAEQGPPGAQ